MPNPIWDEGYRFATQRYDLDGSTIDFEFNFAGGYISTDYVRLSYFNPDRTEDFIDPSLYTFVGPNQIRLPDAAVQPTTRKLIIRRDTPKDIPLLDFTDDAILNERNLDKNTKQAIHGLAEMVDFFADVYWEVKEINQDVLNLIQEINNLIIEVQEILGDFEARIFIIEGDIVNIQGDITTINNNITLIEDAVDDTNDRIDELTFLDLTDTPNSYTGQDGNIPTVEAGALVFKTITQIVTDGGEEFGVFLE